MYCVKILLLSILCAFVSTDKLRTVYEWKRLDFDYDNKTKQAHLDSGFYNPDVPATIDVDVFYNGQGKKRIFVTIPRFSIGSPITLGELASTKSNSPLLRPYPSIEWHDNPKECKPNRLVSVFRTKMDQCGRFWVLDSGRYNDEIVCPPQIIAFNLQSNTVVHRFEFPKNLYTKESTFVTPTVEVKYCEDTYIYMADTSRGAIAVYSTKSKQSWLVRDKSMEPDPQWYTITIEGQSFELMDGIMGMDLGPNKWANRKLFYGSLNGVKMNSVSLALLKNRTLFENDGNSSPTIFKQYQTPRPSQAAGMAIDKHGIAYFGLLSQTSINCWNTKSKDFGNYISTVYQNKKTMQFPGGVKVIHRGFGDEELWVMTSRFQKFATGTLDFNEVNFRISYGRIPDVLKGTKCINPNNE